MSPSTDQLAQLQAITSLYYLSETFTEEDDEHGNPIFAYSSFAYIADDHVVYFGQSNARKFSLTMDDIRRSLKVIPDGDVYPPAPSHLTRLSMPPMISNVFLKGPKLSAVFLDTNYAANLLLQEAEILERLMQNPHPNIVRYHGCLVQRDRIVRLVLDRYCITLDRRLTKDMDDFNIQACMIGITSAVSHLHSLGLAHNDLNPANIMVDEQDNPFLIDFGSCQPFGCTLITAGTPGWIEDDFTTSAARHDEIGLDKLRAWLEKSNS